MSLKPLNERLFNQLQRKFGSVRISNEGEAFVGGYVIDYIKNKEQLQVTNPGEYYQVSCPKCHDTKHRLYFNHRWGKRDERGRLNLFLVICYNENCYDDYEAKRELYDSLNNPYAQLCDAPIEVGKIVREAGESTLPGPVFPLHTLRPDHDAVKYLAGRMYDTDVLSKFWGVGYCPDSHYSLAQHRIIAPIHFNGKLRGWQARMIGDPPKVVELDAENQPKGPPKWWSDPQMKKSLMLYNYDTAVKFKTGVVVEGPSSTWGVGPAGLATIGSSVSGKQLDYLRAGFKDHSLVWLWDPDVQYDPSKLKHMNERLAQLEPNIRGGIARVWLPDGSDAGSLDRQFLHDYIKREAKAQGVKVSLTLR